MDRSLTISRYSFTHTDLVRFWVIASLTLSCVFITSLSLSRHVETIYAQLFYFPILYATYFYPRKGLFVAGFSAIAYEILAYFYVYPDIGGLIFTSGQAILFICIAAVVSYFTEKINSSEARYRSIFETSLLGIALFDENNFLILMANTQFERMLGYSPGELTGKQFSNLFVAREEQRRFYEYLGSNEEITNFETALATKDRDIVWVDLSWRRIENNQVSCSVIDINQRKIAEQIAKSVDHEHQIVNQMLELSVLNAGKIQISYSIFPVGKMVKSLIDMKGYQAKAEIATEIPDDLTFEADEHKISIVIDSMLSNAISYSKPPRKIRISYLSTPQDTMHRLAIQDNGVGITGAQLDEIFQPVKLPEATAPNGKYDRIGLSLMIAKKYVQMHGGYISVDSVVNVGSTFTIHIPKQRPAVS